MRGGHAVLVRLSTATIMVKPTRRVAVEFAVRSAVSARTPLIARRPDRPNLSRAKAAGRSCSQARGQSSDTAPRYVCRPRARRVLGSNGEIKVFLRFG